MLKKLIKKLKCKILSLSDLHPIRDWHTNNVLKGYSREGIIVVPDLPVTQLGEKIVSIWQTDSLFTRIKFLITGKVNFQIMAPTHAPINISIGEYEQEEENQDGK